MFARRTFAALLALASVALLMAGGQARAAPDKNTSADPPVQLVQMAAPENFQAFLEPQTTMVDVYYGGRFVMATMATYTPDSIRFHEPEAIIDALPDVIGRLSLINHFTGDLPSNPALVCVRPGQALCGRLEPEFIGVIFDETRFRADVFVHPDLRAEPAEQPPEYLPTPSDNSLDLVQGLSLAYSGSDRGDDNYTLFGRTRSAAGTRHLFSDWVQRQNDGFTFETLGYQEDLRDHQIKAGLFDPVIPVLRAMRQQPLAGASMARSFHARTDYSSIIASRIELFLANRSQVDLFRDGRLYDSRVYDSGNQLIETGRLPPGAYLVDIRITDVGGATRTLQRFFVKSSLLAPAGHDVWFAEIGRVMDRVTDELLPEDGGATLVRGGYQKRLTSKAGVGLAGASDGEDLLTEVSGIWVEQDFEVNGELFGSTDGGAGYGVRGNIRFSEGTTGTLTTLRVWPNSQPPAADEYRLLADDIMQRSLQFSRNMWGGNGVLAFSQQRANSSDLQETQSFSFIKPVHLTNRDQLNYTVQLSRTNGDMAAQLAVEWRRARGNWQYQLRPRYSYSDNDQNPSGLGMGAQASWQDGERYPADINIIASADMNEDQSSTTLSGKHGSQYGEGNLAVTRQQNDETDVLLSSAYFNSNLAYGQGKLAAGGPQQGESAVIVDLRGGDGALFDIMVDGQRAFSVKGGTRTVIALRPYRSYRILLKDKGTDFVRYDESAREITLYPGQTETLTFKPARVLVIVGTLMYERERCDEAGQCTTRTEPLGDVILSGTEGVTITDPDGFFQGEILSTTQALRV